MVEVLALMATILVVVVGGQNIVPVEVDAQESVQHQPPFCVNIARMIGQLAHHFQQISAGASNPNYPCIYCEYIFGFIKNMTTNKTFADALVEYLDVYVCNGLVPSALKAMCTSLVSDLPALIDTFADDFLDPKKDCAAVCSAPVADTLLDNIVKLGGSYHRQMTGE